MVEVSPAFPERMVQLAEQVKDLSKRGFPMRKPETQVLATQFAEANGLKGLVPRKAVHYWFQHFLRRNPGLRMRKLDVLSSTRALFQCENSLLLIAIIITGLGIQDLPGHICNWDETGLKDNSVSARVVAKVGSTCFEITANESGETMTQCSRRVWAATCHIPRQKASG